MKKIALIGCGNIGSRHLQALVQLSFKTEIIVVDPKKESQTLAKSRLNEINYDSSNFDISWSTTLENVKETDLVIIATSASKRIDIIEKLLEMNNSRFLLEKMVCQSSDEYDHLLSIIDSNNAKGWTNTSRRYMNSYQEIKKRIKNNKINLIVTSGNMGLGTNAIHFVDLFSWLTNDNKISLNGDNIENQLLPNKRGIDLKEFSGTIVGKSSNNSSLSINFLSSENLPLYLSIFNDENSIVIDETNETIFDLRTNQIHPFKIEYQSTLTTKIVNDIIVNDVSFLPSVHETKIFHNELFRIFNKKIKEITGMEVDKCPIT